MTKECRKEEGKKDKEGRGHEKPFRIPTRGKRPTAEEESFA
jgi:hypothetical protein